MVRGFCYKRRPGIGRTQGQGHIPETVDYDLWCGPAEKGPLDRAELHYDWHWVWDTGCGELGNNGAHQLDDIRWMLREQGFPRRVMSLGGRFGLDDAGQTPNTQLVFCDYPTAPVIYEVRGLSEKPGSETMDTYSFTTSTGRTIRNQWKGQGPNCGLIIQCEGGYIDLAGRAALDNQGKQLATFSNDGAVDPQSNFIKAVRSRQPEDLKTNIEQGHLSACLSHLGNISYRLGKTIAPEAVRATLAERPRRPGGLPAVRGPLGRARNRSAEDARRARTVAHARRHDGTFHRPAGRRGQRLGETPIPCAVRDSRGSVSRCHQAAPAMLSYCPAAKK